MDAFATGSSACPEVRIDIPDGAPDVDRLLEARDARSGSLRCRVRRLRDKGVLELYIEEGNVFQLAACKKGKDWLISEQQQGGATRRHVARVRTHKDRSFTCVRERYEQSNATPELLIVTHATVQLSDDLPELNTMQLALPRAPLGLLDAPQGSLGGKMRRVVEHRTHADPDMAILESRKPKWNARTETYELPFGGRANWASARNFQLVDRDGAADRAVLLYGKMEEDEFALDFAYPLSMLHALASELRARAVASKAFTQDSPIGPEPPDPSENTCSLAAAAALSSRRTPRRFLVRPLQLC